MKIISKFKDFYDFEMTRFGVDEKLVYHRRTAVYSNEPTGKYEISPKPYPYNHAVLLVGNQTVHLFYGEHKIYSHLDLVQVEDLEARNEKERLLHFQDGTVFTRWSEFGTGFMLYDMLAMNRQACIDFLMQRLDWDSKYGKKIGTEKDKLLAAPLVLIEYLHFVRDLELRGSYRVWRATCNPNLQAMGIYLDSALVWQALVDFLSSKRSEREVMPAMPNDLKVAMKGFDLKTSFRPNMKKKK